MRKSAIQAAQTRSRMVRSCNTSGAPDLYQVLARTKRGRRPCSIRRAPRGTGSLPGAPPAVVRWVCPTDAVACLWQADRQDLARQMLKTNGGRTLILLNAARRGRSRGSADLGRNGGWKSCFAAKSPWAAGLYRPCVLQRTRIRQRAM